MEEGQRLIANLELARREALVAADKVALADLLSDDLLWTHANGVTEDKATYLAAVGTKARFTSIKVMDERITLYGMAAAVVAELAMTIKPIDQGEMTLRTRASSLWAKERGAWRLVRFHSGMVT